MATDSSGHAAVAIEAAKLAGWPEDAVPSATLLPGGATGETFKLTDEASGQTPVVVRTLSAGSNIEAVSKLLAESGISPAVLGSSESLLLTSFINGQTLSVTDLADASGDVVKAVGDLVGRLHGVDPEKSAPARDELAFWLSKTEASFPDMPAALRDALREEIAFAKESPPTLTGAAGALVTGHGDLHPGNIMLDEESKPWVVDLEHVCANTAAFDINYFFQVWGDTRYTKGWTPSADTPTPYAEVESRRAFAAAYLTAVSGSAPSDGDVSDFLLQVELCGHRTRARLMCIWILLANGDASHMMVGAAGSYLPHLKHARAILDELAAGSDELKADVISRGLIVVASARSAAAAAAAATTSA